MPGDVRDSISAGKVLMKDYEILTMDEQRIYQEVCRFREQERMA